MMTYPSGILSFGAYIPRRRLSRASIYNFNKWFAPGLRGLSKGEKAIANWDEDSVTMAVEAGRDCLSGLDREIVDSIALASTTLPFADRLNAGIVKEAMRLKDDVTAYDVTGNQRVGLSMLREALGAGRNKLCVASERTITQMASESELNCGDAAAALFVGQGDVIAKCIGAHSVTIDFVDHFRANGEKFDYFWESRWIRDEGYLKILGAALRDGLEKFGLQAKEIDHTLIAVPVRGVPEKLASMFGFPLEGLGDTMSATIGACGAAHPFLMLAAALERAAPGQKILLAGFGQGAEVLMFEVTDAIKSLERHKGVCGHLKDSIKDENYGRFLFHRGLTDIDRGKRVENDEKQPGSTLARSRKEVLGLIGGKCARTGIVQYPKSEISVAQNDRSTRTLEDYPLAEKVARILTFTADQLTYSPDPPCYYGIIDFDGGGRMMVEFADVEDGELEVGREMRMVFRIKAVDEMRNFTKYFWKARPA